MTGEPKSRAGLVYSGLLFAAVAVAAFPLLSSDGLVFRRLALDFHPVVPWLAAGGAVLLLSNFAEFARRVLEGRPVPREVVELYSVHDHDSDDPDEEIEEPGHEEAPGLVPNPMLIPAAMAQGVFHGLGWALLAGALLTVVASIPSAIAARPEPLDAEVLEEYLQIFGALTGWAIAAGVYYGIVRVLRVTWPTFGEMLLFPWRQLLVLAGAFVLLSGGGVLSVAFGISGGSILTIVFLALALPYFSAVVRQVTSLPLSDGVLFPARVLLLVCDIGWMVLVLGIMLALPGIAGGIQAFQDGGALESSAKYLEILDTLAFWSAVLLVPFILIRMVSAFRPTVGEVFGFPMGRLILFALALIAFSDKGVPATASSFPIPNLMPAMTAALAISYLALVLRRVGQLGLADRFAVPLTNIPPLIGSAMPAVSASLIIWALLQFSPLITAPLLDGSATASAGESALLYFAGLNEVRHTMTAFVFVLVLCLALPEPLWAPASLRVRPMLVALGFTAAGCLLWLSMAPLSGLGHVFPLVGTVIGLGLLTLALSQASAYLVDSREPLFSAPARWLTSSRSRGFVIGAAVAFYAVLMRPFIYETLWFAAVYEWVVVLAIAVWAMFKMQGSLHAFVETEDSAPANWPRWQRHEQQFDDHPDPRRNLLSRWQRTYVESGDWTSLWTYLMGLLCRSNAPPEAVRSVIRPLRESSQSSEGRGFLRWRSEGDHSRRESGLARSLQSAEHALTGPSILPPPVDVETLREASVPFIENGSDPESMAGSVIAAYRRRGADYNRVISLWFPLVSVVEPPRKLFEMPWTRRRIRATAQERRRRLAQGAISHLSGEGSLDSLPVGLAAQRTPMTLADLGTSRFSSPTGLPPIGGAQSPVRSGESESTGNDSVEESATDRMVRFRMERVATEVSVPPPPVSGVAAPNAIAAGQGFEILEETGTSFHVRTADNRIGYVSKSNLQRLPILPGDEVNAV